MKIVSILLAASIVGNIYLLSVGQSRSARSVSRGKAPPVAPTAPAPPASPERLDLPFHPDTARSQPGNEGACLERVKAAERAVAEAKATLLATLPARKAFELGDPNPIAQERLSAVVERIVAKVAPLRTHAVECRDTTCRIAVLEPAAAVPAEANTWMRALREDRELANLRSDGLAFERRRWVRDEGSGAFFREMPVFVRLRPTP